MKGGTKLFRLKCWIYWKNSTIHIIFEVIANCLTFKPSKYKPRVKKQEMDIMMPFHSNQDPRSLSLFLNINLIIFGWELIYSGQNSSQIILLGAKQGIKVS